MPSILFLSTFSYAQTNWTVANQATFGWNEVTALFDGTVIPDGDVISYNAYLRADGDTGDGTLAGNTANAEFTITFPSEGKWIVGVQTVRAIGGDETNVLESIVIWSDSEDTTYVPSPFGFIYYIAPNAITGLGPK